jgi:hypothetical protein
MRQNGSPVVAASVAPNGHHAKREHAPSTSGGVPVGTVVTGGLVTSVKKQPGGGPLIATKVESNAPVRPTMASITAVKARQTDAAPGIGTQASMRTIPQQQQQQQLQQQQQQLQQQPQQQLYMDPSSGVGALEQQALLEGQPMSVYGSAVPAGVGVGGATAAAVLKSDMMDMQQLQQQQLMQQHQQQLQQQQQQFAEMAQCQCTKRRKIV